ncbi:MAG: hypothetical protein VKJ64_04125 [Leptolyngbyaceae bacterium]|nr:hypothetical protein [Leptolyngbyaceae bacterium]
MRSPIYSILSVNAIAPQLHHLIERDRPLQPTRSPLSSQCDRPLTPFIFWRC